MKNKENLNNLLIKRNVLSRIHKKDIRIKKKAAESLNKYFNEFIIKIIELLAKEAAINGKKTIEIVDIKKVFEKINEKETVWEV
ncbi:MAG: hypothetical protein NTX24_04720 [Candidatus Pacearchaeota archaeon]|nr:hypothetical protein [Candidatus Pacearchaeota archaeon]